MLIGAAGALVLAALIWVVPTVGRLISAGVSVSSAGLRIAQVKRGTLTRDISAQGKVVAAQSPTLYATAAGTVTLLTHAGDKVTKDQVLAEVDSPELKNKLEQEQATFVSLDVDVERAGIEARQKQLLAKKTIDRGADRPRQTAAREVDRNQRGFKAGAIPEINVLRAQDALAKADLDVVHAQADAQLMAETGAFEQKTKRLALERQKLLVADLQRQVDLLKVRSPVAGQVGQLLVQQSANVAANAGHADRGRPERARNRSAGARSVRARSRDRHAGGNRATACRTYTGEVSARCRPKSSTARSSRACASATRSRPGLRQNQRLTTRILIDEHPNVLMVERGSFVDSGGGRVAYRRARRRRRAPRDPDRRHQPERGRDRLRREGRRPHRDLRHRCVQGRADAWY